MKKRMLSFILSFCMALTLLPVPIAPAAALEELAVTENAESVNEENFTGELPAVGEEEVSGETPAPEEAPVVEVPPVEEETQEAEEEASLMSTAAEVASGICGGEEDGANLTWVLTEDGVLTITGTGAMAGYGATEETPWVSYADVVTSVVIGYDVTTIGNYAFSGFTLLTAVSIPGSVTTIGENAFSDCTALTEVVIPGSVTSIGSNAFGGCSNLAKATIIDGGTAITLGSNAFEGCTALTEVTIPGNVTAIGSSAFKDCTGLAEMTICEGVKSIGQSAFENCAALAKVIIPDSVNSMGLNIFAECSGLTSAGPIGGDYAIQLGWTNRVPGSAFNGHVYLTEVVIPAGVTFIGGSAFNGCTALEKVTIPGGVTSIGSYAFSKCTSLTRIRIPEGVETLPTFLFRNSTLEEIWIPSTVTKIGRSAFELDSSSNLKNVYYGGAAWDGVEVANGNSGLTEATIHTAVAGGTCGTDVTWNLADNGVLTIAGAGNMKDYLSGNQPWASYADSIKRVVVEHGVTSIGRYAFCGYTNLADVDLSASVEVVGRYAFSNCTGLNFIELPAGVTTISERAFLGCTALTDVLLTPNVTEIGNYAFHECPALRNVYCAPVGDQEYLPDVGTNNTCLTDADIRMIADRGDCGVDWDNVFWVLDENYHLALFGNGEMLDYETGDAPWFSEKEMLTGLTIGTGIINIGEAAFFRCITLTDVEIPTSVATIGENAFANCSGLQHVAIPEGVTEIGSKAFYQSGLTSVEIPKGMKSIGAQAFGDCDNLQDVIFVEPAVTIADPAFTGVDDLSGVYYFGTEEQWGQMVEGMEHDALLTAERFHIVQRGACGAEDADLSWFLDSSNELILLGIGAMMDYEAETAAPWDEWKAEIKAVIIKDGVTSIGSYAFDGYTALESYTYSPTSELETIGAHAFEGCTALTAIGGPDSVTTVGDYAYAGCTSAASVTFNHADLGQYAFSGCSGLTGNIAIGGNLGAYAFKDCAGLEGVTVGGANVGQYAFSGCAALTTVILDKNVETVESYAFAGCTAVEKVWIYGSGTVVAKHALDDCTNLTTAGPIGSGCSYQFAWEEEIPAYAFAWWSGLTAVTLPDTITSIGEYAFYKCSSLTSAAIAEKMPVIDEEAPESGESEGGEPEDIVSAVGLILPAGVLTVGNSAFRECAALPGVEIPEGVTTIGSSAFRDCAAVTRLIVPASAAAVGSHAFDGCNALTAAGPIGVKDENGEDAYDYQYGWTTAIPDYAFDGCSGLTEVALPDELTSIGNYAFRGCSALEALNLPEGVQTIGKYAFANCGSMTSIVVPAAVTTVGEYAFANCAGLTSAGPIGAKPESGEEAYAYQYGWTRAIPAYAFDGCIGLTEVAFSGRLRTIGNYAFRGCTGLLSIIIPDTVSAIGDYAFRECTSLSSVFMPNSVKTFGKYMFYDCTSLTSAGPVGGAYNYQFEWMEEIPKHAFSGCKGLTSVTLPATVTKIGSHAFAYCSGLQEIKLPDAVETISDHAFWECTALRSVTIPTAVTSINKEAFLNAGVVSVHYAGDRKQWNAIAKKEGNDVLSKAAIYCAILTSLDAPTQLAWNKEYAYNGITYKEVPGMISWKRGETAASKYTVRIYRLNEDESSTLVRQETVTFESSFQARGLSKDYFITGNFESGTYYYTVQAIGDKIQYKDSEAARSETWEYTKPEAKISQMAQPAWAETADGVLVTWELPEEKSNVYGLEYELYYSATADGARRQVGGVVLSYLETQMPLSSTLVQQYGLGCYWFRVRAFSNDIMRMNGSDWSKMSEPYMLTESVEKINQQLNEQLAGIDPEAGNQNEILKAVQGINTQSVAIAMAADKEGTGTLALIEELEKAVGAESNIQVDRGMKDTFNADAVSIVGAGLNASSTESTSVDLRISQTTAGREVVIPNQYHNALQVSMHLDNAVDADQEADGQQLAVPVKITLPVPTNVNPAFLVILHQLDSTGEIEEITPQVYKGEDGYWYASFIVTSFSSFALVETTVEASVTAGGVRVTAWLEAALSGKGFCVIYDTHGRQLGIEEVNLRGMIVGANRIFVPCDSTYAAEAKLFLMGANNTPMYVAASCPVTA